MRHEDLPDDGFTVSRAAVKTEQVGLRSREFQGKEGQEGPTIVCCPPFLPSGSDVQSML